MISLAGVGVLTTLAFVLALSAIAKLRSPPRDGRLALMLWRGLLPVAELAVAMLALGAPTRVSAGVLACLFGGFAVWHVHLWRNGVEDCGCFGDEAATHRPRRVTIALDAASALAMVVVVIFTPPSLFSRSPGAVLGVTIAASIAAVGWRRVFMGASHRRAESRFSELLVNASAAFIERRVSRRTLLLRVALMGSALSVAPLRYLLYPISALAAIDPGGCGGGLCNDGWTVFCCEVNGGQNTCPPGTFPGGWWMCTSYSGGQLCAPQGVRYYVDCNALPGSGWPCVCANGSCANRREACNIFRYGQCNPQIGGVTAVVCRMVVCENPGSIPGLNCNSSVAVDDAVCAQDVPCLQAPAIELRGAGGV